MTIISAITCLESFINMIIDKYPTKPEYKKLKDIKKKWRLVNNFLNKQNQLIEGQLPFSDFAKLVDLRNDSVHYFVNHKDVLNDFVPIYNEYGYANSKLAVGILDKMIENISSSSSVPLPRWLKKFKESDIRPMDYKTKQAWSRIRKHIKHTNQA